MGPGASGQGLGQRMAALRRREGTVTTLKTRRSRDCLSRPHALVGKVSTTSGPGLPRRLGCVRQAEGSPDHSAEQEVPEGLETGGRGHSPGCREGRHFAQSSSSCHRVLRRNPGTVTGPTTAT